LHEQAGARWSDTGHGRVPRNYGDPATEYDAARNDVVIADRSDRRLVRVHGRDPVRMIQGLISNDITKATADRVVYATALTAKGKMVADMRVLMHGVDVLLEVDSGAADAVMSHLRKFVPPLFARFEDASVAWGVIGVYGPRARAVLMKLFGTGIREDVVEDDLHTMSLHDATVMVIATSHFDIPGFDLIVPTDMLERVWQDLTAAGVRPAGHATLDVLRIEAGSPRWGAELAETTIPLEAGLRDRAISQTKGCYTGQEVIIRILHRGHVNWLLRRILMGDTAAPAADTALISMTDGKKVGRITSAAWSPKWRQTIGLGYVRREVEVGAEVHLESADGPIATIADAAPIIQNGSGRH
jgi:folate-binding protein YgfZ